MAENILLGKGLSFDFYGLREIHPFRSFMPPLYPFLMAFFIAHFPEPYLSLLIIQTILSSLTALNIYYTGLWLFGRKTGLIAGIGVAIYPVFIISSTSSFYPVTIDIFLISLIVLLAIKIKENENLVYPFAAGIIIGISGLSIPQIIAFYPFIILWLFISKTPFILRKSAIIAIMTVLMLSPWLIRNYSIHSKFLISTNGGFNFWLGNNPFTTGIGWEIDEKAYRLYTGNQPVDNSIFAEVPDRTLYPDAFKSFLKKRTNASLPKEVAENITNLSEANIDSLLFKAGLKYIVENPSAYIKRSFKKISYLMIYRPPEGRKATFAGRFSLLYVIHYMFLTPLVLGGIVISMLQKNWKDPLLLYFVMIFFVMVYMNFFVLSRYRWLFEPYMIAVASFFIIFLYRAARSYCKTF
jgi:4-amino-4-deoxy-L-arabinose transferase-like glycosyltransferase